jgi:hypothetical protein
MQQARAEIRLYAYEILTAFRSLSIVEKQASPPLDRSAPMWQL